MSKRIQFTLGTYRIDIQLNTRITTIWGYTATGKTLIYNLIRDYKMITGAKGFVLLKADNEDDVEPVSVIGKLKNANDSVVVIDNADHILRSEEVYEFILEDYSRGNYYILLGRDTRLVHKVSDIAMPSIKGNDISIKYLSGG